MRDDPWLRRIALPSLLALSSLVAGCDTTPPTPEEKALQHQYQMGCRPEDAQGLERAMPYCGHDGGGKQ